MITQGQPI